jgi:hypothetical protein
MTSPLPLPFPLFLPLLPLSISVCLQNLPIDMTATPQGPFLSPTPIHRFLAMIVPPPDGDVVSGVKREGERGEGGGAAQRSF